VLEKQTIVEKDLVALAKRFRQESGKTRAQAAREMKVAQTCIFHAEESPHLSLQKLRVRMIEAYSPFKVTGPVFFLEEKQNPETKDVASL
jgi:DNA-binding XRE family transcriptional regulator